jgi:hypothetical protein
MKRSCIAALVALLGMASLAAPAHAIGVMASWWQLDESNEDGFGIGLRSKVKIAPLVAFDTRASWIKFGDPDANVFPIEATGILQLGMVYGGLGVGYYIFDAQDADLDNNFGWYVAAGIDVGIGKFSAFGELKWTMLSTDIGNATTELDADGFGVNVGVLFGVPMM